MRRDSAIAACVARSTLGQRLRNLRLVAAVSSGKEGKPLEEDDTSGKATAVMKLERYFDRQPAAVAIPTASDAIGSNVATDVATARRILRLKRAKHEEEPDCCTLRSRCFVCV